jgi:hypothetical protein
MDHPETRPGEVYVDDARMADWPYSHLSGLKTLRLGETSYDLLEGTPLHPLAWRPMFVSTREAGTYKYIMAQRRANIRAGKNPDGSPKDK